MKRQSQYFLPALIAVGSACGVTALPAHALELGEIQVNSALGQPLRASISYALNPNEQINSYCIYFRTGRFGDEMPTFSDAAISITGNAFLISGNSPIREPILNVQVGVNCAYTPRLMREYTLMIDPVPREVRAGSVRKTGIGESIVPQTRTVAEVDADSRSPGTPVLRSPAMATAADRSSVAMNGRYLVQPGDSVSTIVSRIENRRIGLWRAVDIVFAANPEAFSSHDKNRIIAGSSLYIPDLNDDLAVLAETPPTPSSGSLLAPGFATEVADRLATPEIASRTVSTIEKNQEAPPDLQLPSVEESLAVSKADPELRHGDVVMLPAGSDSLDTATPAKTSADPSTGAPFASSAMPRGTGTSATLNWLIWLGGTGIALILGLLLFGRALRERFGPVGDAAAEPAARRRDDDSAQKARAIQDVDFEFADTINAQAISLDADLGAGTGLSAASMIDVAQDFGFSATSPGDTDLDLEITEAAAREPEFVPTDIIAPHHRVEPMSILDNEEPPIDDDYDLSMIVDATKQRIGEYDATEKDLQAVQIGDALADDVGGGYTLSSAVDYLALEQDYQEEFTATMALNAEIERVAMELASLMDGEDPGVLTTEMPIADSTQLDSDVTAELTTEMPESMDAENDSIADASESDSSRAMSAAGSDITVEMPAKPGQSQSRKK
ncbi:MAG: hypothetical protein O2880_04230 [Proteobacteria bacterium]|nr:hypothetical protein [Pseudomonadota bacterium]